jgi:NitT/TauT family transport system substrate-binding protein
MSDPRRLTWLPGPGRIAPLLLVLLIAGGLLPAGCKSGTAAKAGHVRVAYIGLSCEAPIFVAYEKGFFKEEGLDVDLVKTDWDSMKDGLGLGRFDATHTLVAYVLKPIEQGLDVKLTGGIHKGCLRVQAGLKTNIHTVEDLRGKRIATSNMGSPPFIFANRALAAHGIDPARDVKWVVYPADAQMLALDNGQIDAVCASEPIGTLMLKSGKVRNIVQEANDPPYNDEYCCVVSLSGRFAALNPAAAAKVTRALLKAAAWVHVNPTAAVKLSVEKQYMGSTIEFNTAAISKLSYDPAVERCRVGLDEQAKDLKRAGLLNASTDPIDLVNRAWLPLPGVSDAWVKTLKIDAVPGGGPMPEEAALAALLKGDKPCCNKCCVGD